MNVLVIIILAFVVTYFIYNYYVKQHESPTVGEVLNEEPVVEEQPFIPETIKPKSAPRKRYNKKTAGKKPAAKTKK